MHGVAGDTAGVTDDWGAAAQAIKRERKARGWSIRDACAVADISPTTWINAEKGMRISELTQAAIERALGWPDDEITRLVSGGRRDPDTGELIDATGLSEADKDVIRAMVERLKARR